LLLTAAGFKAYALWTDPSPALSWFFSPRWQVALIEGETLLGLWLLSGLAMRWAWLLAQVGFILLAGVSLYLALAGKPSCGCFGKLTISPWYTFGLDVAAVAALWYWRPTASSLSTSLGDSPNRLLRPSLYLVSGVTFILVGCFTVFWLAFPSPSAALAFLRGESLTVEPSVVDVGSGLRGEERDFSFEIQNYTNHPICLMGGTVGCRCITTGGLPLTLPAGVARSVTGKLEFKGRAGEFQYPITLYTDDGTHSVVIARVTGKVVESPEP
jgi:hypothetical protein